mgnify:CR=1 FL=1
MAVEFNIGTLSPEESTILGNFKYIQNTLFPDGNIPPLDEIQDLLKDGNPSIKDAYIGKFYASGVPTDPFLLQHPDTKEFASKFSEAFSQKVRDTPTTILGAAPQMQAVSRQFDLNTSYKDFVLAVPKSTKTIKGIASPLKTAVSNVIEGKEVKAGKAGGRKLGKNLGLLTPQLIQTMANNILLIEDEVTRHSVIASLFGSRAVDITGMRTTKELADRTAIQRPFYSPTTGTQINPDRSGRKKAGPSKVLPPVTQQIFNIRHSAAGVTGEMFPKVTRDTINAALKKYVFKDLPEDITDLLDRSPSTYTDLRRITAAFVANQLGDPKAASEIISHTQVGNSLSLDQTIDKVMVKFYTDIDDPKGDMKRTKGLLLFERELAKGIGQGVVLDGKSLASALGVKTADTFNYTYPLTALKTPPDNFINNKNLELTSSNPEEIKTSGQLLQSSGKLTQASIDEKTELKIGNINKLKSSNLAATETNLVQQAKNLGLESDIVKRQAELGKTKADVEEELRKKNTPDRNKILNESIDNNPTLTNNLVAPKKRGVKQGLSSSETFDKIKKIPKIPLLGYFLTAGVGAASQFVYFDEAIAADMQESGRNKDEAELFVTMNNYADMTPIVSDIKATAELAYDTPGALQKMFFPEDPVKALSELNAYKNAPIRPKTNTMSYSEKVEARNQRKSQDQQMNSLLSQGTQT